jgi:hypothetical protein
MENTIVVVGAGLSGSLMALIYLRENIKFLYWRKGHIQFQKRKNWQNTKTMDFRQLADSAKRSINLTLSFRGTEALKAAGLYEFVEPLLLPMRSICSFVEWSSSVSTTWKR